jgi:hypothetical protein
MRCAYRERIGSVRKALHELNRDNPASDKGMTGGREAHYGD